jgi:uncharacterized protein (DUF885 family)
MDRLTRRSAIALASSVALSPLVGCGESGSGSAQVNQTFSDLAAKWLDGYAKTRPAGATAMGDHRFDAEMDDVSTTGRAAKATLISETRTALAAIDRSKLSRDNQVDAAMLEGQLASGACGVEDLQGGAWDPRTAAGGGGGAR